MTVTDESVDVDPELESDESGEGEDDGAAGRKRDRDFTKFRDIHQELADFVNANSGLEPVTPNQVKAVLLLRSDFTNSPEQAAIKAERKAKRDAEKAKYTGLTDEQIKAAKAADRVEKQADKLKARLEEALAKAQRIREGKEATGEDLASQVESAQNGADESAEAGEKRRIGRSR